MCWLTAASSPGSTLQQRRREPIAVGHTSLSSLNTCAFAGGFATSSSSSTNVIGLLRASARPIPQAPPPTLRCSCPEITTTLPRPELFCSHRHGEIYGARQRLFGGDEINPPREINCFTTLRSQRRIGVRVGDEHFDRLCRFRHPYYLAPLFICESRRSRIAATTVCHSAARDTAPRGAKATPSSIALSVLNVIWWSRTKIGTSKASA